MTKLPGISTKISEKGLGRISSGRSDRLVLVGTVPNGATVMIGANVRINDDAGIASLGESNLKQAAQRALSVGLSGVDVVAARGDTSLEDAIDIALEDEAPIEAIGVVGATSKLLWIAFMEKLDAAAKRHQYTLGVVHFRNPSPASGDGENKTPAQTPADWVDELLNSQKFTRNSSRFQVVPGRVKFADGQDEPFMFTYLPLLMLRRPHEAVDAVKYGPLPLVVGRDPKLNDDDLLNLSNAGYTVARNYYGISGVFTTLARVTSEANSDFDTVEKTRVMNRACRLIRSVQLQYVNDVISATPEGLALFQAECEQPLEQMKLNGEITDYDVALDDLERILKEKTIRVRVGIVPLGKLSYIENEISFAINKEGSE